MNNNLKEISTKISRNLKERLDIFRSIKKSKKRVVILNLSKRIQKDVVLKLEVGEVVDLIEGLDLDEASDILKILPKKKQKEVINKSNEELKRNFNSLLKFDDKTITSLININYIQVEYDDTITSVSKQAKVHERKTGKFPTILVMKDHRLLGALPGYELGSANPDDRADNFVKKIKRVNKNLKTERAFEMFRKNPLEKVVVLSESNNVLGFIYSDDVLKFLNEKNSFGLYNFAGVNKEESIFDSVKTKVNFRYKWLIINLGTAFLTAFTVGLFESTISKYVLLAVYMPIVAGMGGNSATQTLAVVVRGITLGQLSLKTMLRTLKNELGASFLNGIINGILIFLIIILKDGDFKLAMVLAVAMIINLLVAALFGTSIPLIMKKLGKDPASSATVFITTATDILGFVAFLGLATLIL
ncbi:MAG: magnesium transporter [Patescibacteria group bacterium]